MFQLVRSNPVPRAVWLLFIAILIGRGLYALSFDPVAPYITGGGDEAWYLSMGEALTSGQNFYTTRFGIPNSVETIPVAPLYPLYVGLWQRAIPDAGGAVVAIRLGQLAASAAIALFTAGIAYRLTQNGRAASVALLGMALYPAIVLETPLILTETLYMGFIMAGLWLYVEGIARPAALRRGWHYVGVGMALGLATLTRPVALLFPIGLAAHALLWGGKGRGRGALLLLLSYAAVAGIFTLYMAATWNRFVIGSTQMMPAIWRGAISNDGDPAQNDDLLNYQAGPPPAANVYTAQISATISSDPLGYLRLRLEEWAGALAMPHGLERLGDESLRDLALRFVRDDLTWQGFTRLLQGDAFALKALMYVAYWGLWLAALIGLWRGRAAWRMALVPLGFIAYTLLIHLVLLALPRYIFPIVPCLAALAMLNFRPQAHLQTD